MGNPLSSNTTFPKLNLFSSLIQKKKVLPSSKVHKYFCNDTIFLPVPKAEKKMEKRMMFIVETIVETVGYGDIFIVEKLQ